MCRLHSGQSSDGESGPHQRRGLYSEVLPPRLREAYESSLAVRGPLLGRKDVAILQYILDEKIAELDRAASSPDLDDVVARAERMASEWRSWDTARMGRELAALDESLRGRDRRDEVMREIRDLTREKASLVAQAEAEDRLHAEFISIDDVMFIVRTAWLVVQKSVHDPKALEAIEAGICTALEKFYDDRTKGTMRRGRKRARS